MTIVNNKNDNIDADDLITIIDVEEDITASSAIKECWKIGLIINDDEICNPIKLMLNRTVIGDKPLLVTELKYTDNLTDILNVVKEAHLLIIDCEIKYSNPGFIIAKYIKNDLNIKCPIIVRCVFDDYDSRFILPSFDYVDDYLSTTNATYLDFIEIISKYLLCNK